MICPMKQIINLDSSTLILILKKKKKKKNNYIDFYNTKWNLKMIDVHTIKKKRKKRKEKETEILYRDSLQWIYVYS